MHHLAGDPLIAAQLELLSMAIGVLICVCIELYNKGK